MRSENEVIHYRARFNVTSSRDGVDPFHAITALMLGWFTKKEEQLSRRNAVILLISLVVLVTAAFLIGKYRRRAEDR